MKNKNKKIDDFGEFIPGNFKHHGAMSYEEFEAMNQAEQRENAKRDKVWPKINAEELVANGVDNFVVYLQTRIRRMTKASPEFHNDDISETAKKYVKSLTELRDVVMSLKDEDEIRNFARYINSKHPEWENCVSLWNVRQIAWNMQSLKNRCIELNFPYNNKKKKAEDRKQAFKLAPLDGISREGEDYRKGKNANEKKWENTFAFRGVVFGASVPQKERQDDLNYGYDGIMDLAVALGIENTDVSFGGKLNISFAARGRGYSAGHYETVYEVINMTRLRGAGTFAKLWFHALDDAIAKYCGITSGILASEAEDEEKKKLPKSFNRLIHALKQDDCGNETSLYIGSGRFDKHFKKNAYGAWGSNAEMASRAFACYLKDCIGCKSDYVVAHADSYHWQYENEKVCAIPQGDERKIFNQMFEDLFYELKQIGFFHERKEEKKKVTKRENNHIIQMPDIPEYGNGEQLTMFS